MTGLTEKTARAHIDDRTWTRGASYTTGLTRLTRQPDGDDQHLRGTAHGTDHYEMQVTLRAGTVRDAVCSCPVGGDGRCKHVAALLRRALIRPGDFLALPSLDDLLGPLDAPALRGVIRRMLDHSPDLISVLLSTPGGGTGLAERLALAFATVDYDPEHDWNDEGADLSDIDAMTDELFEACSDGPIPDALNAARAFVDGLDAIHDEVDTGVDLAHAARTALLLLLGRDLNDTHRADTLNLLTQCLHLHAWHPDEIDGTGQRELYLNLPPERRAELLGVLDGASENLTTYRRAAITLVMLDLDREGLMPAEHALHLARRDGHTHHLIERLIPGDPQAALQELSTRRLPLRALHAAFAAAGHADALLRHAETNPKLPGARLYLFEQYRAAGRQGDARRVALDALTGKGRATLVTDHQGANFILYRVGPNGPEQVDPVHSWVDRYREVSLDWATDLQELVTAWQGDPNRLATLINLLLDAGQNAQAAQVMGRRDPLKILAGPLAVRYALALPGAEATPLILKLVTHAVAQGNRDGYRAAATMLRQASAVIGAEEARSAAALLRAEHPRRRSLHAELGNAGF